MSLEIEAKFRVASHEPVRRKLGERGAAALGRVLETNHLLDRAGGELRAAGSALRVRTAEPLQGGAGEATLTFKGPIQPGSVKQRQEIEVRVSDAEVTLALLEALGFAEVMVFRKRRESYRLDLCRIELDELPRLGRFVEIEGPDQRSIEDARRRLDLGDVEHLHSTYVDLLAAHCQRYGGDQRWIDFGGPAPGEKK